MIRKSLLLKLFDAAYIQRWNDRVRPVEFVELDKQAQKMVIAYFLGKFEEDNPKFSWIEIIEGGIFELLQRIVAPDFEAASLTLTERLRLQMLAYQIDGQHRQAGTGEEFHWRLVQSSVIR